jgi:hypothetical protein
MAGNFNPLCPQRLYCMDAYLSLLAVYSIFFDALDKEITKLSDQTTH